MTFEIVLILAIVFFATLAFAFEIFSPDKIAFSVLFLCMITQLTTPEEAISGFSNPAVITILCLMIIATGLEKNGVIDTLSNLLNPLVKKPILVVVPVLMLITAGISSFISTTAVVVFFLKIIENLSDTFKVSKTKLLLPISFAGIIGGSCTLMGTSTNLIVNNIYKSYSGESFGFFEFSYYGIAFLLIAIIVIPILVILFLPDSTKVNLNKNYEIGEYLMQVKIPANSSMIGQEFQNTPIYLNKEVYLLNLKRGNFNFTNFRKSFIFNEGDIILLRSDNKEFIKLIEKGELELLKEHNGDENIPTSLYEILILPKSFIESKNLDSISSNYIEGAKPLAVRKHRSNFDLKEKIFRYNYEEVIINSGDRLLIEATDDQIQKIYSHNNLIVLNKIPPLKTYEFKKKIISLSILVLTIVLAATGVLSILQSSIMGVFLILITNCLNFEQAYRGINWQVIFLIACILPLGTAMHSTGADDYIVGILTNLFIDIQPFWVITFLFLISILLSGFISNNATAIIIAPMAITLSYKLQIDVKALMLAVMFGSNFSFFTPVGYQTNTLIYGTGYYKFRHFLIIGGILSILFLIIGSLMIYNYN